jgi:hypothetical protein
MAEKICYAPVFKPSNVWTCFIMTIILTLVIAELVVLLILAIFGGPDAIQKVLCMIKQTAFRMSHCLKGNSDPNIAL